MDEPGRPYDHAAAAGNVLLLGIGVWGYLVLPRTIPTHFALDGRATESGPSWTVLMLPLASAFGATLVWFFNKIGVRARPPFHVPEDRRDAVNAIAGKMNSVLLLVLASFFIAIESEIIGAAGTSAISLLVLPTIAALLLCIFAVLGTYMATMYRAAH